MSDKKHAELINFYIEKVKARGGKYWVEEPYNYYGTRGFVDLVVKYSENPFLNLYEFETKLDDVGRIIRKVKANQHFFAIGNKRFQDFPVQCFLIVLDTEKNRKIAFELRRLFERVPIGFLRPNQESWDRFKMCIIADYEGTQEDFNRAFNRTQGGVRVGVNEKSARYPS